MDELTSIYEEHIRVFIHMAKKYHFLDSWEDIISCGHVGFMQAIHKHEDDSELEFVSVLFREIMNEIKREYFNRDNHQDKDTNSLDVPITEDGGTLLGITSSDYFHYSEEDIKEMVCESLFEVSKLSKELIIRHFIYEESIENLSYEYDIPVNRVRRITLRGYHLIKLYLHNNDLISDWAMEPSTGSDVKHIGRPKALTQEQARQLKFIRQTYMNLTRTDYANILDCDIRSINYTLDYPTTTFIRYGLDDSIDDKAKQYIEERYPDTLPGEVKVYEMV